jgi:hypothetical protein
MPELTHEPQRSTKNHAPTEHEVQHEATERPKTTRPDDSMLTSWFDKPDVCSAKNAPVVCERSSSTAEPIPEPFNLPVPGMHCVPPPRPVHWDEGPSRATCPTEMIHGDPIYKPEYQSENLETYKAAFSSSWSDVQAGHNALVLMHRTYRDEEKDIIPILQVDSSRPVGAGVQGIDASKSFVGGKLKPSLTKIDSSKLSTDLRAQIFKSNDKIKLSELDIANKRDLVTNAEQSLFQALNKVEIATNSITIEKTDAQLEHLQLDKEQVRRDLEDYKAKVKVSVESAKLFTSFITCWSDPTKLFGNVIGAVNQGAVTAGAAKEAMHTTDANAQLAKIDGQVRRLKNLKGSLRATNAHALLEHEQYEVDKRVNDMNIAVRVMEASMIAHRDAYREMGTLIDKAGAASGLNPKDRKAVAGAVEAVPKIEMIQKRLQGMDEGLQPPPYNEASGIGAAMASNVGVFTSALATVKGNREYVAELKALWEARRASVMAAIERSTSVTGED